MPNLVRRVRALLSLGAVTGLTWALVGLGIASTVFAFDPGSFDDGESVWIIALYFGRAGVVAGMLCGGLIMLADRQRTVGKLRYARLALWGAVSGLTLPLIHVAPTAMLPFFLGLGAVTGASMLALARRGERLSAGAPPLRELPDAAP